MFGNLRDVCQRFINTDPELVLANLLCNFVEGQSIWIFGTLIEASLLNYYKHPHWKAEITAYQRCPTTYIFQAPRKSSTNVPDD